MRIDVQCHIFPKVLEEYMLANPYPKCVKRGSVLVCDFGSQILKRIFLLCCGAAAVMGLASCVSLSEMEALQAKYDQTSRQYSLTQQELLEIKEGHAHDCPSG